MAAWGQAGQGPPAGAALAERLALCAAEIVEATAGLVEHLAALVSEGEPGGAERGTGHMDHQTQGDGASCRLLVLREGASAPEPVERCAGPLAERAVILVHGLNEPGGIWDGLVPALAERGYTAAVFEYAGRSGVAALADGLAASLRQLRGLGVLEVDLVCHSMGGLVARDVLTRPGLYAGAPRGHGALPDVRRLILVGTPNLGAPLAPLQPLAAMRQKFFAWAQAPDLHPRALAEVLRWSPEPSGRDLAPSSEFLTELNARPLDTGPEGVRVTTIVGRLIEPETPVAAVTDNQIARSVLPESARAAIKDAARSVANVIGDGVVPGHSAGAGGVEDVVTVNANHRGLLVHWGLARAWRRWRDDGAARAEPPPAIPVILDRLGR